MKTKTQKVLPKTAAEISNGGVYQQAVRCGRPGCRCASGHLHQGYYYFIRRINGRLRKTYVPKRLVDEVFLLVQTARRNRELARSVRRANRNLLLELGLNLRGYQLNLRNLSEALEQND